LAITSAEARFTFTAPANNLYTFRCFGRRALPERSTSTGARSPSLRRTALIFPRA
jgi:hypothetical protein